MGFDFIAKLDCSGPAFLTDAGCVIPEFLPFDGQKGRCNFEGRIRQCQANCLGSGVESHQALIKGNKMFQMAGVAEEHGLR